MPNGDNTVTAGDLVEMESQVHHILNVTGEVNQLGIDNVRTCGGRGGHFWKSELLSDDRMG